ncbi:hypothetical protein A5706_01605 [Mycobacterium sp. E796]|nr:hypothetical protein A5706_01605 [Mycobacterium sp. E796]
MERKFDVVESTVSPSFEGIAAIAHVDKSPVESLDATYFDTPGQDLARNKITLRRRTGGHDAGWHLKLPSGPEARTEVRAPLDASEPDTVPGELRDVVVAELGQRRPVRAVEDLGLAFGADPGDGYERALPDDGQHHVPQLARHGVGL